MKSETEINLDEILGETLDQYKNYSLYFQYPIELKGYIDDYNISIQII